MKILIAINPLLEQTSVHQNEMDVLEKTEGRESVKLFKRLNAQRAEIKSLNLMHLMIRLVEIQNGFAEPKALSSHARLSMRC